MKKACRKTKTPQDRSRGANLDIYTLAQAVPLSIPIAWGAAIRQVQHLLDHITPVKVQGEPG